MEELATKNSGTLSILEDVRQRVNYYARRGILDWLKLGEALTEAKELVQPGEWLEWVQKNAGMGKRMCQNCMQAYAKFGTGNPDIENLSIGQVIPLLPASEEEIMKLMDENDLSSMSSREIQKAIQKARKEAREEAEEKAVEERRDALQCAANDKAASLAKQKAAFDEELRKQVDAAKAESASEVETLRDALRESKATTDELMTRLDDAEARAKDMTQAAIDAGRDMSVQNNKLKAEAEKLRRELEDRDAAIAELQEQYDAMREDLGNAQSTIARGDAERSTADILSAEAVGDAVRIFIGQVGRVPFMHGTFAMMDDIQRDEYRANVMQVKEWVEKSLAALETVATEGGVY